MDKKFHKKVIALLPSKDLIKCVNEQHFEFREEDLLKFINDYSLSFDEMMALFEEAAATFTGKQAKRHAKKLIDFNRKNFDEFMREDADCVYEINIKCHPDDADEDTLITKSFPDALEMIKSWLKCYSDVGAKDNKFARYTIVKKTTTLPKRPIDLYKDKVGSLGKCVLGHKFKILNLDLYKSGNEITCKANADCDECKTPCVSWTSPHFPHFLKQYDLVAFQCNMLLNPREICYGILGSDMEEYDYDSYVIDIDNEYIKNRNIDYKDNDGWYGVYMAHCHPSYAKIFKPDPNSVPQQIYDDYVYAVEGLKKLDEKDKNNDD